MLRIKRRKRTRCSTIPIRVRWNGQKLFLLVQPWWLWGSHRHQSYLHVTDHPDDDVAVVAAGVECRHHCGGSLLCWSSKHLWHVQNSEQERSANISHQEDNDNDETIQEETVVVTSGVKPEEMRQKRQCSKFCGIALVYLYVKICRVLQLFMNINLPKTAKFVLVNNYC